MIGKNLNKFVFLVTVILYGIVCLLLLLMHLVFVEYYGVFFFFSFPFSP